jgi:hypothetical protein
MRKLKAGKTASFPIHRNLSIPSRFDIFLAGKDVTVWRIERPFQRGGLAPAMA